MAKIPLVMAIGPYEHTKDIGTGRVPIEGVALNFLDLPTLEIFDRFEADIEFDVAEMSFGRYLGMVAAGRPVIAVPVFPSRLFRHGSVYVQEGGITDPADLAGKRIGVSEWPQTATLYVRGWMQHELGIDLAGIDWVLAGTRKPLAHPHMPEGLPAGINLRANTDRTLGQLVVDGELDAVISAGPPDTFKRGDKRIKRLFANPREIEEAYFRKTRIFPIMHVMCMRRELAEQHPWLPANLLRAFETAKQLMLDQLRLPNMSRVPLPWAPQHAMAAGRLFGEDFWPYGIAANRPTLEALTRYAHEQGVTARKLAVEELFAATAHEVPKG